jgi:hypothetical protein
MEPGVAVCVAITVNLLVAGEYKVAAASSQDTHFDGAELRAAVESLGRTLVELPEGWEDDPSTVVTVLQDRPERILTVAVNLWTLEEGRSDIVLTHRLRELGEGEGMWAKYIDSIGPRSTVPGYGQQPRSQGPLWPPARRPPNPSLQAQADSYLSYEDELLGDGPRRPRTETEVRNVEQGLDPEVQKLVEHIVGLLVDGQYDAVTTLTNNRFLDAAMMRAAIEGYGRTLIRLPTDWTKYLPGRVIAITTVRPSTVQVIVDLWTVEQARSDLALVLVTELDEGVWSAMVDDIRVL